MHETTFYAWKKRYGSMDVDEVREVVRNEFESDGDLGRIYGKANAAAAEHTYANSFTYTPDGRIERLRLGNGLWESAKFNSRLQVTEFSLGHGVASGDLWKLQQDYGELQTNGTIDTTKNTGNIARQTVSFDGLAHPFITSYKYDSLYRLTEAKETQNAVQTWKQAFSYDRYGNRIGHEKFTGTNQITLDGKTNPTIDANTNRFNPSQGYIFDKNGNLTTDPTGGGRSFVFNGDNKQKEVRDAYNNLIGEYFYDGEGKRIKKHAYSGGVLNEVTVFVYSSGKLIAEYSTVPPPQNPTTNWTITDQLGSPRILVNSLGEVVSRRDFMPFGEEIIPDGNNLRTENLGYKADTIRQKFTGYLKDEETQLDFAEARMYQNLHGRFTAVDPLLASGKSANPQTFNRYVYAMNRPLRLTDPNGLQAGDYAGPVWTDGRSYNDKKLNGYHRFDGDFVKESGDGYSYRMTTNGWTQLGKTTELGAENTRIKELLGSFRQATFDTGTGAGKGFANAFIDPANAVLDFVVRDHLRIPSGMFFPNPVQIARYPIYSETEARFSTAFQVGVTLAPGVAAAPFRAATFLSVVPEAQIFRFSQTTASTTFSIGEGPFSGRSVMDVAGDLRAGTLSPSRVPIEYVQRGSFNLIDNTRSSIALQEAGVPMNQWSLVNRTGNFRVETAVSDKLVRNGLTNTGTNSVTMGGCRYFCH